MRIYAYIRKDPDSIEEHSNYISSLINYGYKISESRIVYEEVTVHTPINYRDKFINLIEYGLEEGDLLIVKGIDSLGRNFGEISKIINKIEHKKIRFICWDFSKNEIIGDLYKVLKHLIHMCLDFETKLNNRLNSFKFSDKKVGRPEILNENQKEEIIIKYKKGRTIYSLAKEYSVTRTVIQRVLKTNHKVI